MTPIWIVFVPDDDGFIDGIFDNEISAYECKKYNEQIFLKTFVIKLNEYETKSAFIPPTD
jgi:hypothetical protein